MMDSTILTSLFAALGTTLAGSVTVLLQRRLRQDAEVSREEARELAEAYLKELDARKAAALEVAVERLPAELSKVNSLELVEALAKRLPAPTPPEASPIERLISTYHEQALGQASTQFWFSIIAATVGFAWILGFGLRIDAANFATVSQIIPGAVMDAVAFLFFRQAAETRQRATELYDRLRQDKQAAEGIVLVASIEDVHVRSRVKAQIALHLAGLAPQPIDLSTLSRGGSQSQLTE